MNLNILKDIRNKARSKIVGQEMRKRLRVDALSVVSSDCTGGCLYHDLGLRFDSPFINMFLPAGDYVRVVGDLKGYLSETLVEASEIDGFSYPVARLGDAVVHLVHYNTVSEARMKWEERVERFDYKQPLFIMNDRNGFTPDDGKQFACTVEDRGVIFVHSDIELGGRIHICKVEGCADDAYVPIMTGYQHLLSVHRRYDCFDFVEWINKSIR